MSEATSVRFAPTKKTRITSQVREHRTTIQAVPVTNQQTIAVVIVNFRGARDTVACLESLLRSEGVTLRAIVVENGSGDDSTNYFHRWTQGLLSTDPSAPDSIPDFAQRLVLPPIAKPLAACWLEAGEWLDSSEHRPLAQLSFINSPDNLGFAGGNNLGLSLALLDQSITHFWILNNDTVVEKDSLQHMVTRLRERPGAGICGSTIRFYDDPQRVQAFGGARYFPRVAVAMHLGRLLGRSRRVAADKIEKQMDYVSGTSMLVSRLFVESVGLMSEDYFLYFEELDWAQRGMPDFTLAYAPDSIVFHKGGASIGSNRDASKRSELSEYYLQRNRLRISRRFFPKQLTTVRQFMALQVVARLTMRRWKSARLVFNALIGANQPPPK